ncbi:CRISPR-associated helicase/endonuclease Cas3 [Actinomadura sp. NBRC 104425]|nr:CRISPR-associated helicase/endonuclease Cas3 [Actinomadura sp. NBRC 104425]
MELTAAALAVWGKTGEASRDAAVAADEWHPLVAHLVDAANVAAWLWDHWLPKPLKDQVAAHLPGGAEDGRRLMSWLAALHDLGKASDFQSKSPFHARRGREAGLPFAERTKTPHSLVSAYALHGLLSEAGWSAEWPSLVIGGHHGVFPGPRWRATAKRALVYEHPGWAKVRREIFQAVTGHLGVDVREWRQVNLPVPVACAVAGAVILADWLASTESLYAYEGAFPDDYPQRSAARVHGVREVMGLRDVWRPDAELASKAPSEFYPTRWPRRINDPRDVQRRVLETAQGADGPGLMIVEAPMGDGKTEAALAAAEVLAAKTGADGILVALPTQATANQMFGRVSDWLKAQGGRTTVVLAHGKADRQDDYRTLLLRSVGVDECDGGITASRWLSGGKKRLLAPVVVGTIDQVLLAGVAVRHVALRHLGLTGKVLVIDEVHAYDAYMSTILRRVLAWLGALGVPVILLSATLPSRSRAELVSAYARREVPVPDDAEYPQVTWIGAGQRSAQAAEAKASKADVASVRFHDESEDPAGIVPLVRELLSEGGCALVIRNTVGRAQRTYDALAAAFGSDAVTLAHARFTMADRRAREQSLVDQFGPEQKARPSPHVVVATQVAEQSLDVDFDVLVSDLAPVDLLLQRLGRVHRHEDRARPERLRRPQLVVAGCRRLPDGPPRLPAGSVLVYGEHLLWRTAAALDGKAEIELPRAIPKLIEAVYGTERIGPDSWQRDLLRAADDERARRESMELAARQILLPEPDCPSLARIGDIGEGHEESDAQVQATVRLGARTIEVVLLRDSGRPGRARPVSGDERQEIPLDEAPPRKLIDVILDQAIRLPQQLTEAASQTAYTPPAWRRTPWLSDARVLLLPADGPLRLGGRLVTYGPALGLEDTRA